MEERMKRDELISLVNSLKIDKDEFWILSSGALVIRNIYPDAGDLDIAVTQKGLDELKKNYNLKQKENGWYIVNDRVECVLDTKEDYKIEKYDGYNLQSIEKYYEFLKNSNREKDKKRIGLVEDYIRKTYKEQNKDIMFLMNLNLNMGKAEYDMYQDIPSKENGQTNLCNGLPFEVFQEYIESQMARKYQEVSRYDTPTLVYIMYVDFVPVGEIGLRLKLNDDWKNWSGNFYYKIRKSQRNKGYGTKILELGLEQLKRMKIFEVYGQSSKNNIASSKIIEKNGGVLYKENNGTKYYKIKLEEK